MWYPMFKTAEVQRVASLDWQKFKKIRLGALREEPHAFGSSYVKEVKRSDKEWKDKLRNSESHNSSVLYYAIPKEDGFIAIGGAYQDENNDWNIIAVYTKKEFRGQGAGQKIIQSIISELKSRKIQKAYLRVNILQTAAQALYKKNGFRAMQIVKNQLLGDKKYYDEVEMVLDL